MSYQVEMVCGPGGCKQTMVVLKDDAPWEVEHQANGGILACQVRPLQKRPGIPNAVEKLCIRIPKGLLRKLREEAGHPDQA